jgi:hypothetical protein
MTSADVWNPPIDRREVLLFFLYEGLLAGIERFEARIATSRYAEEMAWVARSLLELEIWVEFCNFSQANAHELWEDTIRDLNELTRGYDSDPDGSEIAARLKEASVFLTGSKKPDKPTYASAAAKQIGLEEYRKRESDAISKLVHPTAVSLLIARHPEVDAKTRDRIAISAAGYASKARRKLASGHLAETYKKFGPLVEQERQAATRRRP